jgi:phospholipid/cholesterol/gamma-HCH transport system substrate-binding protein
VKRVARLSAATCVAMFALAGCGSIGGLYDVTLPGGADVGDSPYRVTAEFTDVLDLVPQSAVKVDDVTVGRVESIDLSDDGRSAKVTVVVNGSVVLPANSVARLRQSSVLGEKFVELDQPDSGPVEKKLADGAQIPLNRTDRNPEIEEVFGALSLLLNGGGVGQLQQITKELNLVFGGNEAEIRTLMTSMNTFVGSLDARKADIARALDGLGELSESFGQQKDKIAELIDSLGPGMEVLSQQRANFTAMLVSLDNLSDVAVDVLNRSKADMVADLKALEPTLRKLTEAGQNLPKAMEMLFTMFPDAVLDTIKGDYINTYLKLDSKVQPPASTTAQGAAALPLPSNENGGG